MARRFPILAGFVSAVHSQRVRLEAVSWPAGEEDAFQQRFFRTLCVVIPQELNGLYKEIVSSLYNTGGIVALVKDAADDDKGGLGNCYFGWCEVEVQECRSCNTKSRCIRHRRR